MAINGPWFLGELNSNLDFSIHPLPIISETKERAKPYLTVEGAMVSAYTKNPKEAQNLASFLVSKESASIRAIKGKQSVATPKVYESPELANDPIQKAFLAQLNHSYPTPNRPEMSATWKPMSNAIGRVARKALTPKAALQGALQEYQIFTRPPPPAANPTPYIILGTLLLLGIFGYFGLQFNKHKKGIRDNWSAYLYVAPSAFAMLLLTIWLSLGRPP